MHKFVYIQGDVIHHFSADEVFVCGTMVKLKKSGLEVAVINLGPGDVVYQTAEE